jgi:hypothetical protein
VGIQQSYDGTSNEVTEFLQFTATWEAPFDITSIEISEEVPGLVFTYDGTTLTASGVVSDVFPRTLDYIDTLGILKTVSRFIDLPDDYYALVKYIPPGEQFSYIYSTANYTEEVSPGIFEDKFIVHELIIRYNFETSNAALKVAVAEGIA